MKLFRKIREEPRTEQRFAWLPVRIVYSPTDSVWVWLEYYTVRVGVNGQVYWRTENDPR